MGEKLISEAELASILGDRPEKTGETFTDLERRSDNVRTYLRVEAASMKRQQPQAYDFLTSFAEANITRERGAELDTPPESVADVRLAIADRQREVDHIAQRLAGLGSKYQSLRDQAESLREHLQASMEELASADKPEKLRLLYREATTQIPLSIRDLSRDAYDQSLGPLAADEMFSRFPGEIELLARGEPTEKDQDDES